jgi:hypothetical protein
MKIIMWFMSMVGMVAYFGIAKGFLLSLILTMVVIWSEA